MKAIAPKLSGSLKKATLNDAYSSGLKVTGSTPITFVADLPEYLTLGSSTISGSVPDTLKSFKPSKAEC